MILSKVVPHGREWIFHIPTWPHGLLVRLTHALEVCRRSCTLPEGTAGEPWPPPPTAPPQRDHTAPRRPPFSPPPAAAKAMVTPGPTLPGRSLRQRTTASAFPPSLPSPSSVPLPPRTSFLSPPKMEKKRGAEEKKTMYRFVGDQVESVKLGSLSVIVFHRAII